MYPVSSARTGRMRMKPPIMPLIMERTVILGDNSSASSDMKFELYEGNMKYCYMGIGIS